MDNALSPEMQQQIRAYCDKVCAMHGLDDVREELQDHFEDKMLAYLSCTEKLQEQDAFLLVREHFGDAAALKSMFRTVHVREAGVTLGRRIAAAAAATLALTIAMRLVYVVLDPIALMTQLNAHTMWIGVAGFTFVHGATMALVPVLIFLLLRRWDRASGVGAAPWYARRSIGMLILTIAGLLLAGRLVPYVGWSMSGAELESVTRSALLIQRWVLIAVGVLAVASQIVVWLWWCDRAPRTRFILGVTVSVWLGFHLFSGLAGQWLIPGPGLLVSDRQIPSESRLLEWAAPSLFGNEIYLSLMLDSPSLTVWRSVIGGSHMGLSQVVAVFAHSAAFSLSIAFASILLAFPAYFCVRRVTAGRAAGA